MEQQFFDYETFIKKQTEKRALKRTALAIGLSAITYFVTSLCIGFVLGTPTSYLLSIVTTVTMYDVVYEIYTMLCYILPTALAIIPIAILTKIPTRVAIPMRRVPARVTIPSVMMMLACSTIGIIITSLLITLFQSTGLSYNVPPTPVPMTDVGIIMYLINISVIPAILEEILCRGYVLQSLRRFGDLFAIVVSALIFTLFHGNFLQFANPFILGLVVGFIAVRTGSLIPGMILHFLNNFLVSILDIFVISKTDEITGSLITLGYLGCYLLIGIIGLVILLSTQPGFFTLRKSDSPLTKGELAKTFFLQPVALTGMLMLFAFCFIFFML